MEGAAPADAGLSRTAYLRTLLLAALLGVPVAAAAVLFQTALHDLTHLVWEDIPDWLDWSEPASWYVVLVPVLAGARTTIREAISGGRVRPGRRRRTGGAAGDRRTLAAGVPTLLLASGRNVLRRVGRLVLTLVALSLAGAMFDRALRRMTNAFEQRAAALYGISSSS